jgi:hypothetical protein
MQQQLRQTFTFVTSSLRFQVKLIWFSFANVSCDMSHMGNYKVKFENEAGSDESTGKVTIKPVNLLFKFFPSKQVFQIVILHYFDYQTVHITFWYSSAENYFFSFVNASLELDLIGMLATPHY